MGRHETLTSWALGRGAYEDEIIQTVDCNPDDENIQQYNSRGHPRNPETKRMEREMVQAANEVMQVTGVVEDSRACKAKAKAINEDKLQETFTGLRYMEFGKPLFVAGVWGVLGLRRRVLLYKPYAQVGLIDILRYERTTKSLSSLLFTGIPTVAAYHATDYLAFVVSCIIEGIFEDIFEDEEGTPKTPSPTAIRLKNGLLTFFDLGFCYLTLHLRWFSILQQLNLIPGFRLFPSFMSFIPFTPSSQIQLPPSPPLRPRPVISWGAAFLRTLSPLLIIYFTGRVKLLTSKFLYRPIYKALPRPTGESIFSGMGNIRAFDGTNHDCDIPEQGEATDETHAPVCNEDEQALRALEGYPPIDQEERERREEERMRLLSQGMERPEAGEAIEEEEEEVTARLISFDVEATEPLEESRGNWSAELRSADEPKSPKGIRYRVTGLTMLPTVLATEGLRDLAAGIITLPFEAMMVRGVAMSYLTTDLSNFYEVFELSSLLPAAGNILGAVAIQFIITGVIWTGYTYVALKFASRKKSVHDDEDKENGPVQ